MQWFYIYSTQELYSIILMCADLRTVIFVGGMFCDALNTNVTTNGPP